MPSFQLFFIFELRTGNLMKIQYSNDNWKRFTFTSILLLNGITLVDFMNKFRIEADTALNGTGEIVLNAAIVVENNKIQYFGEIEHAPSVDQVYNVPVVMPGMWEAHGHFFGIKSITDMSNPMVSAIRSTTEAYKTLMGGITSVREVGGYGIYLNKAIQEGAIRGPRIYGAGAMLSMTGGHADLHSMNLDVMKIVGKYFAELVDGVPECLKGTRKQLRNGAEIIKIHASGGVMSELDHPIHQQFSVEEMTAIVEEAKRADRAVAAHCHGAPGIRAAIEAGVTTIEHGTWLDEDLADQMIEKGIMLVPTIYVQRKLKLSLEHQPKYVQENVKKVFEQRMNATTMAIKKGVKIAMGSDIFYSNPKLHTDYGENAQELEYLVELGMKPQDAIIAATSHGPQTLGKMAPLSGQLKQGFDADILILGSNPVDDITILHKPDHLRGVIKAGIFEKKELEN